MKCQTLAIALDSATPQQLEYVKVNKLKIEKEEKMDEFLLKEDGDPDH